jgi:hypothetical protein
MPINLKLMKNIIQCLVLLFFTLSFLGCETENPKPENQSIELDYKQMLNIS